MSTTAIGIDIGGTFTKVVVLDGDGAVVHRERMPTDPGTASRLPDDVARVIERIESAFGATDAIGIACPGLVRRQGDAVHWMRGRLDVLEGLDWTRALDRRVPVRVINDAQAALAGECAIGAGRGCRDVVLITIGTGVGGAIMCDGRVLSGHVGRAGHLGHIALQVPGDKDIVNTPGSLEDAIGNCTIATRTGGRFTSTADLLDAHRQGDAHATQVWQTERDAAAAPAWRRSSTRSIRRGSSSAAASPRTPVMRCWCRYDTGWMNSNGARAARASRSSSPHSARRRAPSEPRRTPGSRAHDPVGPIPLGLCGPRGQRATPARRPSPRPRTGSRGASSPAAWSTSSGRATAGSWSRRCGRATARSRASTRSSSSR